MCVLLIPYKVSERSSRMTSVSPRSLKMLRNQRKFLKELQDLADKMRAALLCIFGAKDQAKDPLVANAMTEIMKVALEASSYINGFLKKGFFGTF